jgi:phosphate transport system substrate-binding protein
MKKIICTLMAILLLGTAAMAECPRIDAADYPVVDGSTATLPLSYRLMEEAAGVDEETAKAEISHNKTTESFYALVDGSAQLLLVYEPSQDAWDYAKDQGVELLVQSIGYDAPVFLINDANPVESLTPEQIVGIYSGKITNWAQVGGNDQEIVAYQRVENSGSQVMMKAQVMKDVPMTDAPKAFRTNEMGELVDAIASYRNTANSIGYSVYYYIDNMYMKEGIKLLSVDGVAPANDSIASGAYPYRQPFYAVIRADAPADSPARQLYDWLATAEGRALVENAGYVAAPAEAK